MQTVRKPPVIFFITGVITMKRLTIAMLSAITVCLFLAACKTNTDEKPESSQLSNPPASSSVVESSVMESSVDSETVSEAVSEASRQDEAENGVVTDDNGIIGDGDNSENAMSEITEDAVSGAQSIADNAGEGLQSAGEDIKNAAENAADNVRDGISDAVSDNDENDNSQDSSES